MGFSLNGNFETVYANEFDACPVKTYELNSDIKVDCRDICSVNPDEIPDFDVCLAGFPCQSFSIAGLRQGFNDTKGRGTLFFEVIRIIEAKRPWIVFFENVKNLEGHDDGKTLSAMIDTLNQIGYHTKYKVLNAKDFGNIPPNRERIYIVGFLDKTVCDNFEFPEEIPLTARLSDVIDFDKKVDDKYYYTAGKYIHSYKNQKNDIYEELLRDMTDVNAVYQWRRHYVRKNKAGVVPTLTANMGTGGHNVPLVKTPYGFRKLTSRECFNVQGFPRNFKLPDDIAESKLYKQAGNSVCVSVIKRIADSIAAVV